MFGVALNELGFDFSDTYVLSRAFQQHRGKIQASHVRTSPCCRHRDDASAAAHVQHPFSGFNLCKRNQLARWHGREPFVHTESGPRFLLVRFERGKLILHGYCFDFRHRYPYGLGAYARVKCGNESGTSMSCSSIATDSCICAACESRHCGSCMHCSVVVGTGTCSLRR